MCCGDGIVKLPLLKQSPKALQDLLSDNENNESKKFNNKFECIT